MQPELTSVQPAWQNRIHITTRHGKPVICGTDVLVADVVVDLTRGESAEWVQEYYGVDAEDVRACVLYTFHGVALDADDRLAQDCDCRKCDYNLRGLSVMGRCPECGVRR